MSSATRMAENIRMVNTFTDKEMQEINSMHEKIGQRRLIDSVEMVWFDNLIPGKGRTILGWTVQEMGWEDEQGKSLT
jgi:glycerol 2-dehydrogenase (NADP+)